MMTAAPHSIDPATYLDDLFTQVSPDLIRQMLQGFINQILSAKADIIGGAEAASRRVLPRLAARAPLTDTTGTVDRDRDLLPQGGSTRRMNDLVATLGGC